MSAMRVAIAGCGLIAGGPVREGRPLRGNHAEACALVADARLIAASDPDALRRAAFGSRWGLDSEALYPDTEAMLSLERPDVLIVATPPETHEAICAAGVRHGVRGILCEKPFTGHADAAARVVSLCKESGVSLAVNFIRRWDTSHQELARRLHAGVIGPLTAVFGCYTGTLRGNGSHLIDTLGMMAPGAWSIAWTSTLPAGTDDGALGSVLVHSSGAHAHIAPVRSAEYFIFELHLFGTRGRARLLRQGNELVLDHPAPHQDYPGYQYLSPADALPPDTLPEAFPRALIALVTAIREGRTIDPPSETYIASLALLDAIVARATIQENS